MRMSIRRMTRLTNAFCKKLENLVAAINLLGRSAPFFEAIGNTSRCYVIPKWCRDSLNHFLNFSPIVYDEECHRPKSLLLLVRFYEEYTDLCFTCAKQIHN